MRSRVTGTSLPRDNPFPESGVGHGVRRRLRGLCGGGFFGEAENALAEAEDDLNRAIFPQNDPAMWSTRINPTDHPTAEPMPVLPNTAGVGVPNISEDPMFVAPEMGDYDLQELSRVLSEEGVQGKIVDVIDDEDGEHVEIYVD